MWHGGVTYRMTHRAVCALHLRKLLLNSGLSCRTQTPEIGSGDDKELIFNVFKKGLKTVLFDRAYRLIIVVVRLPADIQGSEWQRAAVSRTVDPCCRCTWSTRSALCRHTSWSFRPTGCPPSAAELFRLPLPESGTLCPST